MQPDLSYSYRLETPDVGLKKRQPETCYGTVYWIADCTGTPLRSNFQLEWRDELSREHAGAKGMHA